MREPRRRPSALARTVTFLALLSALALHFEITPRAFNYVIDVNGTYWGIQDDDSPRVDTGSIRATQVAPGGSDRRVQHRHQRLRGHPRPRPDHSPAISQRRVDARLWPAVRRREPVSLDPVGRHGWRDHFARGLRQHRRQLGPLARHLHQYRQVAHHNPGRVRRTVRPGHDRPQRHRDRRHVERRRSRHCCGRLGGICDTALRGRRWSAVRR